MSTTAATAKICQINRNEDKELYQKFLNLRHQVLRVPIGMSLFDEDLSQEVDHYSFVALSPSNGQVIGCVSLAPLPEENETLQLRQMAVYPEFQAQGLGSRLVKAAEDFATTMGKKRIFLHGRKEAVNFYQKLGYNKISEEFLKSGIPHYAMEKLML